MKKKVYVGLISVVLSGIYILSGCGNKTPEIQATTIPTEGVVETTVKATEMLLMPWDEPGAKQPMDYTWEEFQKLDGTQQFMFQKSFLEPEAFEMWYDQAQQAQSVYPWEAHGAKQPAEYSWEEFEALTGDQQMAFQKTFGSQDEFERWMNSQTNAPMSKEEIKTEKYPWEEPNAKRISEYTWEEFQALTGEQQIAFQKAFWSMKEFEVWAEKANPESQETEAWEEKRSTEYTWEAFLQLTAEEQVVFQNSFGNDSAFEEWMNNAMSAEEGDPWTMAGAKKPEEYSWAEFEALEPDQQMRFQSAFSEKNGFMTWFEKNQPN